MKVLVIETTVFGYDGITNVIINYYKYLDHRKIQMDLVTINPAIDSFLCEMKDHSSKNYVIPYRNSNPFRYIYELKQIIDKGRYDIVHVHGCSATMAVEMLAAKLAGVPIRIAHSHNTKCDHVGADKLLRPFFNKWCNVGFACGEEAGRWMFPKRSFSVIPNGIDLEKNQYDANVRNEMRKKYGLVGKYVIGHIGRFSEQKNHAKLIDIFREISKTYSNSKLVLVGDGELKKSIEQKVQNEGLSALFVGNSDEVGRWLQVMDIIVFPSLFEGLPLGLVEAQAAGLPCIISETISHTTKITDLVEFVDLNASASVWCDAVIRNKGRFNRQERIDKVKQQIRNSHFDIRENCLELCEKYELLIKNVGAI